MSEMVYTTAPNGYRRATLPGHRVAIEFNPDSTMPEVARMHNILDRALAHMIDFVERTLDEADDEAERLAEWNRRPAGGEPWMQAVLLDE